MPSSGALAAGSASAECQAICVPPDRVSQVWPHVWESLQKAFTKTDLGRFKDMEDDVFSGHALLWVAWKQPKILCALVTQLRETEKGKVCLIGACGGVGKDWLPLMADIEKYARAEGCNKIRAIGRKGWLRRLPDFRAPFVVIEKDLSLDGQH